MLSGLHFLTHVGLSWIVANVAPITARDRLLVVLAGTLLDLDGAGIVRSQPAYVAIHRAAGHSLLFGGLVVAVAMRCAHAPRATGILAALSFHLHLLLDLVGTGGLPIRYLWPFSDRRWSYRGHWVLASRQNAAVMTATALGVAVIDWRRRRRPVDD
jgi:inner membrane protein